MLRIGDMGGSVAIHLGGDVMVVTKTRPTALRTVSVRHSPCAAGWCGGWVAMQRAGRQRWPNALSASAGSRRPCGASGVNPSAAGGLRQLPWYPDPGSDQCPCGRGWVRSIKDIENEIRSDFTVAGCLRQRRASVDAASRVAAGAATGSGRASSLVLQRFDLNFERDLAVRNGLADAVGNTEVGAVDHGAGVGTADFTLVERVRNALELVDGQGHRLGDAVQRQIAFDRGDRIAGEHQARRLVGGGRVLGHVEDVVLLRVLVHFFVTEVDGRHVHQDFDAAGLGSAVERDGAAVLVDLAAPERDAADVSGLEARVGVAGVDGVRLRCGDGGTAGSGGNDGGQQQALVAGHGQILRMSMAGLAAGRRDQRAAGTKIWNLILTGSSTVSCHAGSPTPKALRDITTTPL